MSKIKIQELENDIKELKASIDDPDISEEDKAGLKETLAGMESELGALKKAKSDKPKKEKPAKPELKLNGKSFKEASYQELESAFNKRMELVKQTGGKVKTKSIFSIEQASSAAPEATMEAAGE
jgi:hypothetical protein